VVSARCSPLRFCRRICLEATTVEIETLTPRLVSTVAWFLSERLDGVCYWAVHTRMRRLLKRQHAGTPQARLSFLDEAVKAGKIHYIGLSINLCCLRSRSFRIHHFRGE
jgi:hypothetical protein